MRIRFFSVTERSSSGIREGGNRGVIHSRTENSLSGTGNLLQCYSSATVDFFINQSVLRLLQYCASLDKQHLIDDRLTGVRKYVAEFREG